MRKLLLSLAALLLSYAYVFAQETKVTGKVVDGTGSPIPLVSILVKDTKSGTSSTMDGTFTINVPSGKKILVFTAIGYETTEFSLGSETDITVRLTASNDVLTDVIVTGVASATSRKKLTVSVTKIGEERLKIVPATSAANALSGKVAGVRVNSTSGAPGGNIDILLRGDNNLNIGSGPMILVDGIILSGSLTDINVDDIESMEVVKGASAAAMYGSRAGNGVIAITTKRGSRQKLNTSTVTVRNEIGFQNLQHYVKLAKHHPYKLAADYEDYIGQYTKYDGVTFPASGYMGGFSPDISGSRAIDDDHYMDNPFGVNIDQQKEFFKTGINYTNYIGIATRSRLTNLYVSFENNAQKGIIQNTDGYKRQNFRLNVDHELASWLKLSATNLFINTTSQSPGGGGGIFFNIVLAEPDNNLKLPHPDGQPYFIRHNHWSNERNPLYSTWKNQRDDFTRRWLGNYTVTLSPFKWLSIEGSRTIEIENYRYTSYDPYDTWTLSNAGGPLGILYNKGSLYKYSYESNTQNTKATIMTNFKVGRLKINANLSYLYEDRHTEDYDVNGAKFAYRDLQTLENFIPENITNYGSGMTDIQAQNYFTTLKLDYKDKLLFDGMFRFDGSSLFGEDERWHPYYRVSAGYRISEDVRIPGIDELKIRMAHGRAGLRPGFSWQYETYSLGNGTATPNTRGNKKLKPSQTQETEIGINVEFLRKFYFEATYAQSKTSDQFLNVPLIPFLNDGFTNQWQNAGTIESNTLEMTLGANWVQKKDFSWNTNIVFSRIRQEITELPIPPYQINPDGLFYIRENEVYGAIYGYAWVKSMDQMAQQLPAGKSLGDYEVNSDGYVIAAGTAGTKNEKPIKLLDENGDLAFVKIGDGNPDFNMGISNTISWKGIQLYVLIDIKQGGDVYNHKSQWLTRDSRNGIMDMAGVPDAQKKTFDYFQAFYDVNTNNAFWVEDAGFIKFREVALGYVFPQKALGVFKGVVKGASARIIGRNLLTITDYSGYDPEVGSIRTPYDGTGTYPNFRNIAFSLSLEF